jgi:hypothetical protein
MLDQIEGPQWGVIEPFSAAVDNDSNGRVEPLREGQLLRCGMNVAKWRSLLVPVDETYGRKPP